MSSQKMLLPQLPSSKAQSHSSISDSCVPSSPWAVQRWGEWRSWSVQSSFSLPLVPPPHFFPCFSKVPLLWDIDLHKLLQWGSYPQATASVSNLPSLCPPQATCPLAAKWGPPQATDESQVHHILHGCWWIACLHCDLLCNFCTAHKVPAPSCSFLAWVSAGEFLWVISFLCHSVLLCVACWPFLNTLSKRCHPLSCVAQLCPEVSGLEPPGNSCAQGGASQDSPHRGHSFSPCLHLGTCTPRRILGRFCQYVNE